jgi:hypothetical protein
MAEKLGITNNRFSAYKAKNVMLPLVTAPGCRIYAHQIDPRRLRLVINKVDLNFRTLDISNVAIMRLSYNLF